MAEEIKDIRTLLDQLRSPSMKGKKSFEKLLPDAWKLFGLKGKPNLISFEAFLIDAIICCIGIEIDNYEIGKVENIDKETAQKHDSYLLAFGLLKGYYHTKSDGTPYLPSERCKQYLKDSDFIAVKYPSPKPSDNLNISKPNSLPRQVLSTADYRCRNELQNLLSSPSVCREHFKEGTRKFINGAERCTIFPEPLYTLGNFRLNADPGQNPELDSAPPPDEPGEQTGSLGHRSSKIKLIIEYFNAIRLPLAMVSVVLVCIFIVGLMVGKASATSAYPQPVNDSAPQGDTEILTETVERLELFGIIYEKKTTETQYVETVVPVPLGE